MEDGIVGGIVSGNQSITCCTRSLSFIISSAKLIDSRRDARFGDDAAPDADGEPSSDLGVLVREERDERYDDELRAEVRAELAAVLAAVASSAFPSAPPSASSGTE